MLGRSSARKIGQLQAMLRWFRVIVQTGNLEKFRKWKKFAAQIRDDYLLVPNTGYASTGLQDLRPADGREIKDRGVKT